MQENKAERAVTSVHLSFSENNNPQNILPVFEQALYKFYNVYTFKPISLLLSQIKTNNAQR